MDVRIYPYDNEKYGPLSGRGPVLAPPSKSMAHRYLIAAALADGVSAVRGMGASDDVMATEDCLRALGAGIEGETVKGFDPKSSGEACLPCRESGSTLRFLIPLCAMSGSRITLKGSPRLMERPLSVYEDIFRERGVMMKREPGSVSVQGRLQGGLFEMDGSVSSQFISGMLFALPLLEEDSVIKLRPPVESRPYIDMTIKALKAFGVDVRWEDEKTLAVPGSQRYIPRDMTVEGDWSGAAFLHALGLDVSGLDDDSPQGDKVCVEYFRLLDEGRPVLDISDCPDLGPVIMAYAAMRNGCTLTGTKRLRIKESDRGRAMQEELAKFGIETRIHDNSIDIGCGPSAPEEELSGHNDHRIVMALTVLCSLTGGVIKGAEAVNKSFPEFFARLAEAGISAEETDI